MISYLLRTEQSLSIADDGLSARTLADWLERIVPSKSVSIERVGETLLEFRSKFWAVDPDPSNRGLRWVRHGEIHVEERAGRLRIIVRANPHTWLWVLPVMQLAGVAGWSDAAAILRWGAGLGSIMLGGVLLLLAWTGLNSFLGGYAALYQRVCARRQWNELLARIDAALGAYLDGRAPYEETKTELTLLWRELLVFTGPTSKGSLPPSEAVIRADRFLNCMDGRSSEQIKTGAEVLKVAMLAARGAIDGGAA